MPVVTLGGVKFHYQQAGDGPDVVLCHAVTSNLAVWLFSGLFAELAKDFRVTAYDLRGHGYSDAPLTGYTSRDMADDLVSLLAALEIESAILVGHSFGGVVATHAAARRPELVAGLVICDSYFPGLAHVEPNFERASIWDDVREHFKAAGVELGETIDLPKLFEEVGKMTPEQRDAVKAAMGPSSARWLSGLPKLAGTTCGVDVLSPAGLTQELIARIRAPVVALYDEHSPFLATEQTLRRLLPYCRAERIPGAKHLAPVENAAVFNPILIRTLRRLAGQWSALAPAGASAAATR